MGRPKLTVDSIKKARKNSTNLYLPDGLLDKVNAVTIEKGKSRNGWITRLIIKELSK